MAEIVMPRLSDSMEEGTILTWLKQVGDEIAVGDEIVEIETDKANMAYESDVAGTLTEILAQEGETLPIGTPIARVGGDSDEGFEPLDCGACRGGESCGRARGLVLGTLPLATRRRAGEWRCPPGRSSGSRLRRWPADSEGAGRRLARSRAPGRVGASSRRT